MVGTYFRIFERSGRPLAWGLLALRLAGILLLIVILANPVWKQQDVDPGRVVVVLDNSRSMSLPDPTAAALRPRQGGGGQAETRPGIRPERPARGRGSLRHQRRPRWTSRPRRRRRTTPT